MPVRMTLALVALLAFAAVPVVAYETLGYAAALGLVASGRWGAPGDAMWAGRERGPPGRASSRDAPRRLRAELETVDGAINPM